MPCKKGRKMASASNLVDITGRNTKKDAILEVLADITRRAEAGEIQDIVIVASVKDDEGPGCVRVSEFADRLRLLGALEYAKDSVFKG